MSIKDVRSQREDRVVQCGQGWGGRDVLQMRTSTLFDAKKSDILKNNSVLIVGGAILGLEYMRLNAISIALSRETLVSWKQTSKLTNLCFSDNWNSYKRWIK